LPTERLGIFIACNIGEGRLINDLVRQFMDHYYPPVLKNSKEPVAVESTHSSRRFVGSYRLNRYGHRTIEKLGTLFREWEVLPGKEGAIIIVNPNTGPGDYVSAGPLLFRQDGAEGEIAFHQDENGQIIRLFMGRYVLEKLPWYEAAIVQKGLFAFFGCVFGLSVLSALVVWIENRRATTMASPRDKDLARLRYWTARVAAGNLLFLGGMLLAFQNKLALLYGLPLYVTLLLCIPLITTAATPIVLWHAWIAWRVRSGNAVSRVFYTFAAFAASCFVPFLAYWNLLGFHY
jgi:hypothetical protein